MAFPPLVTLMKLNLPPPQLTSPLLRLCVRECGPSQVPIVYSKDYDISFFGVERLLHVFDTHKWTRVAAGLVAAGALSSPSQFVLPVRPSDEDLACVHTPAYLASLKSPSTWAGIAEVPLLLALPLCLLTPRLIEPLRLQAGGSVQAALLALRHGWALNLGGGFHHACASGGAGFCAYSDISLAIVCMRAADPAGRRVLVVDTDAHQGNGYERDFCDDDDVFVVDVYNAGAFPMDEPAKSGISVDVPLRSGDGDRVHLDRLRDALENAAASFPSPDLVVFNAGTDTLDGDPLGKMTCTPAGIAARDALVFEFARRRLGVPILLLTSGGYQQTNAPVIVDSILGLAQKGLIELPGYIAMRPCTATPAPGRPCQ